MYIRIIYHFIYHLLVSGAERARELAKKLGPINMPPGNENRLLSTLTGKLVFTAIKQKAYR